MTDGYTAGAIVLAVIVGAAAVWVWKMMRHDAELDQSHGGPN
jgi:hypothetical protein